MDGSHRLSTLLVRFGALFSGALAAGAGCARYDAAAPLEKIPGALIVRAKADATDAQRARFEAVAAKYGLQVERTLLSGAVARVQSEPNGFGKEEEVARELVDTGAAQYAEPDFRAPLAATDPLLAKQWHHARIRSTAAWGITAGSFAVRTAVCDEGFDINHVDLRPNLSLPGYNVVTGGTDVAGGPHGTMTSGTIAAGGGNGVGVAGVAWNVTLMPIKVAADSSGSASYSALAACLEYAAQRGARVINVSYGSLYGSAAFADAATYAWNAGALVVVSAGNDQQNLAGQRPGPYMLVGATDSANRKAWFSNYGTAVDLVAPGVRIWTTSPGNNYASVDGTSFAAPIVSGIASLMLSANPRLTATQVRQILISSTAKIGSAATFGYGLVDAYAAVNWARGQTRGPAPAASVASAVATQ